VRSLRSQRPNAGDSRNILVVRVGRLWRAVVAGSWTLEEDAKLIRAVANTSKKKRDKEYKTNWAAVAALVPSRTTSQCSHRWYSALDPSIGRATERTGKWTAVEDSMLKDALRTHYYNGWVAISALVPGRTRIQCRHSWNDVLDPNIDRASWRMGKWTAAEDSKLKDAVQTYGDKDSVAMSLLVPGRTRQSCLNRWKKYIDPNRSTVRE
jgi:myb proto-oncogene protein